MPIAIPTGKQAVSIVESTRRINLWSGAVRSGKTVGSIIRWLEFAARGPEGPLLMVGKTERTLQRNVLNEIEALVGSDAYKYNRGDGEVLLFGRRIYLGGANDMKAETKIRGLTLAGAYGDEVSTWPENYWRMLLSRLSLPGASLFATTNPAGPSHWLKRDIDNEKLDLAHFHFTLRDNPHLPEEYVDALSHEYTGLWHRRFIQGEWVQAEGSVYDMWDPNVHVANILPQPIMTWVGIDYGTSNPFAALLVGLTADGRVCVYDELYYDGRKNRQKTDSEYAHMMQAWLQKNKVIPAHIIVDPSAASFLATLYYLGYTGVKPANNRVLDGIRFVSRLFSDRRLIVSSKCENLIREIGGYVWDPKAQERGEDKPMKVEDHTLDSLRYATFTLRGQIRRYDNTIPDYPVSAGVYA